jgi:hypothetical protein
MVRMGILQYGYWPSAETFIQNISKKKGKMIPLKQGYKLEKQGHDPEKSEKG